jgi:hypothetical protein
VTWPWRSADATRRALSDRIAQRYPAEQRAQRLREVAYRRLVARLFTTQPERWVVKGGVALILRLDPNRTSNDIDLTYVAAAGGHAVALHALADAVAHDLGDFFTFEIVRGSAEEIDPDHPLERALSVPVVARVGRAVFAEFSVDLALPRVDVLSVEVLPGAGALTGLAEVDAVGAVTVLTLPAQIADKVCAMFERHGDGVERSSRSRDLADIAMVATQEDVDGTALTEELRREERRRLAAGSLVEPLPAVMSLASGQAAEWRRRWARTTRGAPVAFDEALATATAFLDPVLRGDVGCARWSCARRRWLDR